MTVEPEPHVVLGVAPTATPEEVQRAFRRLVRAHHPDLAGETPQDDARLRAVLAAYAALRRARDDSHSATTAVPSAHQPIVPTPPHRRPQPKWTPWLPPQEPAIRVGPVRWHGFRHR